MLKKLFAMALLLTSCSTGPDIQVPRSFEREYNASFDETWRAVQQSIISYPLKINNMELGQVQTTAIRGNAQFKPPHEVKVKSSGYRYNLSINVIKIDPKTTRVAILKDVAIFRDFVSKPETRTSDGHEENMILYRVGREVLIEKILLRDAKKRESKKRRSR
jgi:hypothetical protein